MKTKDIQTVWNLDRGHTLIGSNIIEPYHHRNEFFVRTSDGILIYTENEMREIYNLSDGDFTDIHNSGV